MKTTILAVIIALAVLLPSTAQASCSGFIDCLFGMTERTEVRAQRDVERARIEAAAQADIARIQAEQAERVRQADAEVERVRQMQFASEAQRDIAIAQAQQQAEQYKAMIAGLTAEKVSGIQSNADTQIAALQAQAQIAIEGITQTGKTERYRIVGGWTFAVVAIVVIAILLGLATRRQTEQRTVVLLSDPTRFQQLQSHVHEIEVNHAKQYHITRR